MSNRWTKACSSKNGMFVHQAVRGDGEVMERLKWVQTTGRCLNIAFTVTYCTVQNQTEP